jgi:hypothetical protein
MKRYFAYWYENDEYEQWIESSAHKELEAAQGAAFKNASKHGVHLYAEVNEETLHSIERGWKTTGSWVNTADTGKWSGWRQTL